MALSRHLTREHHRRRIQHMDRTAHQHEALQSYLDQWKLSDPEPLAKTVTSDLYKVRASGQTAVLKILSEVGVKDERHAADVLQWYGGHGAIQLLRDDPSAILIEYVDGEELTELVKSGEDDEATKIIADVLNKIHFVSQSETPHDLPPLQQRFQSLFDKADQNQKSNSIFTRAAAMARHLLLDQSRAHVLHGDIHHGNILHHRERGWLAIDPQGLIGDRAYDAANALRNPLSLPEIVQNRERLLRQAQIMATVLDIDRERLLSYAFAHACLSACWSLEDGRDPSHSLAVAEIAESCIDSPPIRIPHRNGSNFPEDRLSDFSPGCPRAVPQLYRYIK